MSKKMKDDWKLLRALGSGTKNVEHTEIHDNILTDI
jgi:hypothetical protein